MTMSKVVKLRLFIGEEAYNKEGKLVTKNDTVKLIYGGKEWKNVLNNAGLFGYSSAKVISVIEAENKALTDARKQLDKARKIPSTPTKDIEILESKIAKLVDKPLKEEKSIEKYQLEVDSFFEKEAPKEENSNSSKELEALKKQNELLMKRLDALENGEGVNKKDQAEDEKTNDSKESNETIELSDDELEAERTELSEKYKALKGKAPHHKVAANIEILRKAVSELEAENK
jgi:hypothetical protein